MDYELRLSDNTDTDEDLPPPQNRVHRTNHISANGNSMLGSGPYRRVQGDMDHQIHHLEKGAYFAVLRDFKAQSDAISWDKESLITELRKELRVSDDEHREVLVRVNNDEIICRIREWRKTGGHQALSTSHPINDLSSTTPVSRKKQRTTQSVSTHTAPPSQRGRKPRQFPCSNHAAHESTTTRFGPEVVGQKVLTRWPDDNHFYEAIVSRYNASDIKAMLGDYDAVHVRRGDILKTRKDRFGVVRSRHPHVERDTRPECMLKRIAKWVPSGRTLFIASNERKPGYFSPLGVRYRLAYSSNYTSIVDPVIENNYQLFMLERLILMGAKTFINTFKSDDSAFSLSDDPKKNTGGWMKVVRDEDC